MNDTIKKTFVASNWIVCLGKIRYFIEEFNLELISINMKKTKQDTYTYVAEIEYKLGVRND